MAEELKVQFGSGSNILEGWKNHDMDVDVRNPLPYGDSVADEVFACHLCEHLTGPELLRFLKEIIRVLKPGGRFRMCCPIIGPWLALKHAQDLTFNHGHLLVLNEDVMRTFLWMGGFPIDHIRRTDRREIDGHWRVIGVEQDDIETCRMEAIKP